MIHSIGKKWIASHGSLSEQYRLIVILVNGMEDEISYLAKLYSQSVQKDGKTDFRDRTDALYDCKLGLSLGCNKYDSSWQALIYRYKTYKQKQNKTNNILCIIEIVGVWSIVAETNNKKLNNFKFYKFSAQAPVSVCKIVFCVFISFYVYFVFVFEICLYVHRQRIVKKVDYLLKSIKQMLALEKKMKLLHIQLSDKAPKNAHSALIAQVLLISFSQTFETIYKIIVRKAKVAESGFDPPTFGL